nr:peptide-methionine (S)-S-oxide reductase MsrA [Zavarzinella formosa]
MKGFPLGAGSLLVGAAVLIGAAVIIWFSISPSREFHMIENFPAPDPEEMGSETLAPAGDALETATFGNGCFWCTEAVFQQLKGVRKVQSGYSGGSVKKPTYEQVCSGRTGHAEVIQVVFDPKVISYTNLLEVFWRSHDPTTLNRQGNDVGTQYRSAVFYHSERQRELAEKYKRKIDAAGVFPNPVVTEITPFAEFFPAEDYHQEYYNSNSRQPYCRMVIRPKIDKLKSALPNQMKASAE